MIYFVYLEIALNDPSDSQIYAFENVSHIPAAKLIDIFRIGLNTDPNISEGYFLTKEAYTTHKGYIDNNIGTLNLDKFEYTLRRYGAKGNATIRRLYKCIILRILKEHFLD